MAGARLVVVEVARAGELAPQVGRRGHVEAVDEALPASFSWFQFEPSPGPHLVWSWQAELSSSALYSLSALEQDSHVFVCASSP